MNREQRKTAHKTAQPEEIRLGGIQLSAQKSQEQKSQTALLPEQAPQKQDRRVRKTKAQLRRCLAELMKTKKINEITVKELTDLSDLNRGTFYLHYRDVFDLLEQSENELIQEFEETLSRFDLAKMKEHPAAVFEEVYKLVADNRDIVYTLLGENGDLNFTLQLRRIVEERCLQSLMAPYRVKQPDYFNLYFKFLLSGCIGIIQYWLQSDCAESPEELAAITERIVTEGIHILDD